jgi:hypothetical protein
MIYIKDYKTRRIIKKGLQNGFAVKCIKDDVIWFYNPLNPLDIPISSKLLEIAEITNEKSIFFE